MIPDVVAKRKCLHYEPNPSQPTGHHDYNLRIHQSKFRVQKSEHSHCQNLLSKTENP
jgi:hypothetical protein